MRDNYLRQILIKCVAAILGSQGVRIDKPTFQYLVLLVELRMQETFSDLADIIKIQRHTEPSIDDLMLWITRNNIDLVEPQKVSGKHVDELNSLQFEFDVEDISPEQAVFFDPQLFQIKKIVKSNDKVPFYVPEWSPALPPDHTYMATSDYSNRVRGLQELHEKLFDEGHQAELALQRLLGSKGSDSTIKLQFPSTSSEPKGVTVVGDGEPAVVPTEAPSSSESAAPAATTQDDAVEETNYVPMEDVVPAAPSVPQTEGDAQEYGQEKADTEDQETKEPEAPKPYITIVNSEPTPEPVPSEKPLSFKINLRKQKKSKTSHRPKVDIVQMAQNQAYENQHKNSQEEESQETNLKDLLEQAMASVDA